MKCKVYIEIAIGLIGTVLAPVGVLGAPNDGELFFKTKIRPVLVERCLECHGPMQSLSGLRLDSRESLIRGGDRGAAVNPGDPDGSRLLRAIRRVDDDLQMPPDEELSDAETRDFEEWVKLGAPWPASDSLAGQNQPASATHWAFRSIKPVEAPEDPSGWSESRIDRLIIDRLHAHGMKPNEDVDKRTLLRRASFDLIGLPPSPAELDDFLADESSDSFHRVVDRLLSSPHYGERWGRHWLDVVRYADTAGETADFPVPQAYRYRDYVIQSLNRDKPYDQWIREQIAGDIFALRGDPGEFADLVVATGYLAITRRYGWDRLSEHHVMIADCIDNLGQAFQGLTLGCARCHDHKYDPVSVEDYYAIYGIFDSTRFSFPGCEAEKRPDQLVPMIAPAEAEPRLQAHDRELAEADQRINALEVERKRLEGRIAQLEGVANAGGGNVEFGDEQLIVDGPGMTIAIVPDADLLDGSVQVNAAANAEAGIILHYRDAGNFLLANYAPQRKHIYFHEVVGGNYGPMLDSQPFDGLGPMIQFVAEVKGSRVTLELSDGSATARASHTIQNLSESGSVGLFHNVTSRQTFRDFEAKSSDGQVLIEDRFMTQADTRSRWKLIAGSWKHQPPPPTSANELPDLQAEMNRIDATLNDARNHRQTLAECSPVPRAYAVSEGQPHNAQIHRRGNPKELGDVVPRRLPGFLGGHVIEPDGGSGRLQLANAIANPGNPLTARVMVNRIWQYHFGTGLVRTPNNFGLRGRRPTHPELLDYLAARFIENGWSIKAMHREIMLSHVYRLSSAHNSDCYEKDPENDLYWRWSQQRLDAESVRDAMLSVSGRLDLSPGGQHPFPPTNTWGFSQHEPFQSTYETDHRSVYLMLQRNRRHPVLELFDGADPRVTTPTRAVSTTPAQALFVMNNPFVHEQGKGFAKRLLDAAQDDQSRLTLAYILVFSRPPTELELQRAQTFLEKARQVSGVEGVAENQHAFLAWTSLCRVLLSSNEFIYVD